MKPRLRLLLAALLVAPLAGLVWLGARAARSEGARAASELRALLEQRLDGHAALAAGAVAELERALTAATDGLPADPEALRELARARPHLRRLAVLRSAAGGRRRSLEFPPMEGPTSEEERRFVARRRDLWERGPLSNPPRDEATGASGDRGWLSLEGPEGSGLMFWRVERAGAGRLVAVEISGASLLAAIIARLPETTEGQRVERIALFDGAKRLVYAWGPWEPANDRAAPVVAIDLPAPLAAWRLAYLGPPAPAAGASAAVGIGAGVAALLLAVAGLGVWFYRESTRELRLAAQRVSFVNQVSHELKTPLTNVRMYAELLEDHLPPDDALARKRLAVVVTESQRLGRLITNILTLSRAEKGPLAVHPAPGCVDEVVGQVIDQFTPSLASQGVQVRLAAGAPARVRVDADALAQMLGNLLGNVEKYAGGGPTTVTTTQDPAAGTTTIVVADSGPGIPAAERDRAFEPFVRLGRQGHEGIPGTGIGLGIARDLARQHGGDLRAVPPAGGEAGARFELVLATPLVAAPAAASIGEAAQ